MLNSPLPSLLSLLALPQLLAFEPTEPVEPPPPHPFMPPIPIGVAVVDTLVTSIWPLAVDEGIGGGRWGWWGEVVVVCTGFGPFWPVFEPPLDDWAGGAVGRGETMPWRSRSSLYWG
jgi:hypothetical protein